MADRAALAAGKPVATPALVAATLRAAGRGGCLILGAGALGEGVGPRAIVAAVREAFPETYALVAARDPTPSCESLLAALSDGERAHLFADVLGRREPSPAERSAARLLAEGHLALVLTTALDPTLLAAAVEAGVRPAVYDATAALPPDPATPAIVYLRGQRERTLDLSDAAAREAYATAIATLMGGILGRGHPIVVVGYRGADDPLVERLAATPRFANRLFWVAHGAHPLPPAAQALIAGDSGAFAVTGYDAEGFLAALAEALSGRAEATAQPEGALVWPPRNARRKPRAKQEPAARAAAAEPTEAPAPMPARLRLVVGDYRRLIEDYEAGRIAGPEATEAAAWAHVMLGNRAILRARGRPWNEAAALWREAVGHFEAALAIDPRHADALYNWGAALAAQARTRRGEAAARLWREAAGKFAAALAIAPEDSAILEDAALAHLQLAEALAEPEEARAEVSQALDLLERAAALGDGAAYVSALEVALAYGLEERWRALRRNAPPALTDEARFALALADLVHALAAGEDADTSVFDALPRRAHPPCAGWSFAHVERAAERLADEDAAFVRALIGLLHGERDRSAWPAVRDAWETARTVTIQLAKHREARGHARL